MVVSLDLTQVLLAIVAALSAVATAYIVSLSKKTAEVSADLKVVHSTVNTNFQAQARELKAATDALSDAALQIAILTEKARGADIATAKAQGLSEGILLPTPGQTPQATVSVVNGGQPPVPVEIVNTEPVQVDDAGARADRPRPPPSSP